VSNNSQEGFDKIIGQELAKRVLLRAVRTGNPGHAYLFLGPEGSGKFTTALEFAKSLNCESPTDRGSCGKCPLCHSLEHGNAPDVRVWSPDGHITKISQMRDLIAEASFRPLRGKWLVSIIEQADTLNEEAANCILKIVEEPPEYLVNILIYRNAASILPTIRSRCQLVRFTSVNADVLAGYLSQLLDIGRDKARFLATYSQGCPGIAMRLAQDTEFQRRRDSVVSLVDVVSHGDLWPALRLAEALRSADDDSDDEHEAASNELAEEPAAAPKRRSDAREVTLQTLDVLLVWYRDLLAWRSAGTATALVNSDRVDQLQAQASRYSGTEPLLRSIDAVIRAKRGVNGNVNPQIATEALLLRLIGCVRV